MRLGYIISYLSILIFLFYAGDNSEKETPDPIPNSVVKFLCADGTSESWESRSLPAFFYRLMVFVMFNPHPLEITYGLTSRELLDAIDRRFRLKVALEGAVAEVHFERKLRIASNEGWLAAYKNHDMDGMHDFTVVTLSNVAIRVEVKTIRNGPKPKVELQKTRAAKGDPSSRYYNRDHFDVLAVCIGRYTSDWSQFRYAMVRELPTHSDYQNKLKVIHNIPNGIGSIPRWFSRFQDLIDAYEN